MIKVHLLLGGHFSYSLLMIHVKRGVCKFNASKGSQIVMDVYDKFRNKGDNHEAS